MDKTVTVVGLGAIGCNTSLLLAKLGVNLNLIDRDFVEENNLVIQKLYSLEDVNKPKVICAKKSLGKFNIEINTHVNDLNYKNIGELIKGSLILDCTDNMETRFLINEYSLKKDIPWIYSGVVGNKGMLFSFIPKKTPCFNCIFNDPSEALDTCDTLGVDEDVVKKVAKFQVEEAMKILDGKDVHNELLHFDIGEDIIKKLKVNKDVNCETCKFEFSYLNGKKSNKVIKLCGTNRYQIYGKKFNLKNLNDKINNKYKTKLAKYLIIAKDFTIFDDGRAFINAKSEILAKSKYSRITGV